eukprot:CAMPEP_0206205942 /NCGR_PEP_ID=MMETSP0166-20121206/14560_1 /ASSEMBLY_ACC=CAM_ASM_000260 /TAXON_ID=95228 /ORGANISM="Vannella robusta, Strain DIVA3 518/3/11/1/6" /LENGTH=135 /DNA_ID=CAMNT_0053626137 /DNA_START=45 /DNA_END=448 /DNA_ORIENTATION=+
MEPESSVSTYSEQTRKTSRITATERIQTLWVQTDFTSELSIGFHVFKAEGNRTFRLHQQVCDAGGTFSFINTRQVAQCLELEPGNYVIIPVTYAPGYEGDYMLRVCSYESAICKELLDEIPRELASFPSPPMIVS